MSKCKLSVVITIRPGHSWTGLIIAVLMVFSSESSAQSPPFDEIRDEILESVGPDRLGAGYSALVNFAASPDISAATYDSDDADSTLNIYKLPYRHVFNHDKEGWRPFIQALLSYQSIDSDFAATEDESIDSEWTAYGGSLSGGVEIPLTGDLTFLPAVNASLVRLENSADYYGDVMNDFIKPALTGVVFDWDADAYLVGASIALDYKHGFSSFDFETRGSLTYNHIETYDSSSEFVDFSSSITTFDLEISSIHPIGKSIRNYPLALVVLAGNTTFLGPDSDALGFEYFYEAGLGLEADISSKGWQFKRVRLGLTGIIGGDVTGWSVIFGFRH